MLFCIIKNHAWAIVKYAAMSNSGHNILPLAELSLKDLLRVGGKNASLGELIKNLSAVGVGCRAVLPPPRMLIDVF